MEQNECSLSGRGWLANCEFIPFLTPFFVEVDISNFDAAAKVDDQAWNCNQWKAFENF